MGSRLMLNLRETYYDPRSSSPGAETTIGATNLTSVHFNSEGSHGHTPKTAFRVRSRRWTLDQALDDRTGTVQSENDIPLKVLGSS